MADRINYANSPEFKDDVAGSTLDVLEESKLREKAEKALPKEQADSLCLDAGEAAGEILAEQHSAAVTGTSPIENSREITAALGFDDDQHEVVMDILQHHVTNPCLLYTSPSPRD